MEGRRSGFGIVGRELHPMVLLVPATAIPLFVSNLYTLHILILAFLWAIPAMGVRLILSTGHLSLGQAVFMGIGAYTSVLLVGLLDWSFWVTIWVGGLIASLVAALIGWPALRLKGAYFAMLTFGLGEALRLILLNYPQISGGASGIPGGGEAVVKGIDPVPPITLPFLPEIAVTPKPAFFILAVVLTMIAAIVMHRIRDSHVGRTIDAIEQSDALARSIGVRVTSYKLNSLVVACFFTGVAGAVMAHYMQSVTPRDFTFWQSTDLVLFAIIGGRKSTLGPIMGAVFMVYLSNNVAFFEEYQSVVYGLTAIAVLMLLPDGLASLPRHLIDLGRRLPGFAWARK